LAPIRGRRYCRGSMAGCVVVAGWLAAREMVMRVVREVLGVVEGSRTLLMIPG